MSPPTIVLSYAAVGPSGVQPREVTDHVSFLRECGYTFVTAGDLVDRWPDGGEPEPGLAAVCLDGGHRSDVTVAAPLLAILGVPATHFVDPTMLADADGSADELAAGTEPLRRQDAELLAASGVEIGARAVHPGELAGVRAAVEDLSGASCRVLSWPDNAPQDTSAQEAAARAGFAAAFTPAHGPWRRYAAPRLAAPRGGARALARLLDRHAGRARMALVMLVLELEPLQAALTV